MKSHSFSQQQLFVFSSNAVCCGGNVLTCLGLSLNTGQQLTVILNGGKLFLVNGGLLFRKTSISPLVT